MSAAAMALTLQSTHFGAVEWDGGSELYLPFGLPGFPEEKLLLPIEVPAQRPLVFLQSVESPDVCFVALPVLAINPGFRLQITEEDQAALELSCDTDPQIGVDVLCLALLLPSPESVMANLDAPIVINLHNFRCIQAASPARGAGYFRLTDHGWFPRC